MKRPSLTIVVNTVGRLDCLPLSLGSIAGEMRGREGVEFVLVDNSPDGRVAPLFQEWKDRFPRAVYEREPVMGMIPARNAGIRASRNDVVAYVDDDAVVHPGWMDGLLSAYERFWDGEAPIVVGGPVTLKYPDGLQRPEWLSPTLENWLTRLDWGAEDRRLKHPAECLVGANFSAPRSTLARFGGFVDLGLNYCDERLIEHLVLGSGGSVVYAARAHVDHLVGVGRLTPAWFVNRYRTEGLCRQRMLQHLKPRSRPSLVFRATVFTARMLVAQLRGRFLASGAALRLEAECQAGYARGCIEATWNLLTSPSPNPSRRPAGA